MPASEDEYVRDGSDDDGNAPRARLRGGRVGAVRDTDARDFEVTRTWDLLTEAADGTITGAVEGLLEAGKKRRLLKDTTPLQRGIIRHLILILDMSIAMNEKDLRPTRYLLMISYATGFIQEFFEQNPISQLGVVGMRDGIAERISDMSGNPNEHIKAVQGMRTKDPKGHPSLENALEMSRAALFHAPSHGTREILLIFGALHTSDPGDIHQTISNLVSDKIRAQVIGLAAQVAICKELVNKTNGGNKSAYGVVLNEQHFRELMMAVTTPPISDAQTKSVSSLLMMGFPSRIVEAEPTLCACHARPSRDGYLCSRCNTKVCSLPAECPACSLTLILSTHLARSYHHLFPLVNWSEVPWSHAHRSSTCFSCQKPLPDVPPREAWHRITEKGERVATSSSRFECEVCRKHFCIDCDIFAHVVVHNCPGCQSGNLPTTLMGETEVAVDGAGSSADVGSRQQVRNGNEPGDAMDVDQA